MIRRLLLIVTLGVMMSGCYMAPLALVGPVTSGFITASLVQTGVSSGANYLIKQSTGKTLGEHAVEVITKEVEVITKDVLQQAYFPEEKINSSSILEKRKSLKVK